MQALYDTVNQLRLGEATSFEGLTVFPLFGEQSQKKDYLTLDEALEQEQARVVEVSESGSVPNLLFENLGDEKVLLVDGDELVGAKQNRIVNLTILVSPHTRIEIPVSCVEQGRWSQQSPEFMSEKRAMYSKARASKAVHVTRNMQVSGEHYSNQAEVWDDIAACSNTLEVESATQSMGDIYEEHRVKLEGYKNAFKANEGQVGALFASNGRLQGLEVFDNSETFGHYLERLVSSYALGSMTDERADKTIAQTDAKQFIERVHQAKLESFKALGEGEDIRLFDGTLAGGALFVDERVIHLAAFGLDNASGRARQNAFWSHHGFE